MRCKNVASEVEMELAPIKVWSPRWAKGAARVENGEIVLDEDRAIGYGFGSPEESERVAFDLAALSRHLGDETAVLRFARRWGLLWHGAEELGSGKCREPLHAWWVEATLLNQVGVFYQTLLDSRRHGSAKPIQDFLRRSGGIGFPSLSPASTHFDQDYIAAASVMLQNMINEGLNAGPNVNPQAGTGTRRCWWGLEAISPGEFRLAQFPPDLLSRAYSAFATLIGTSVETRFCPVCGKQFRPKSKRGVACCEAHQSTFRSWRKRGDPRADGS
jgi:hypothetical protein